MSNDTNTVPVLFRRVDVEYGDEVHGVEILTAGTASIAAAHVDGVLTLGLSQALRYAADEGGHYDRLLVVSEGGQARTYLAPSGPQPTMAGPGTMGTEQ